MTLLWTCRAIADVQAITQFIAKDSPHAAQLVAQRLVAAVDRLILFPQSGRMVPELADPQIREVVQGSYSFSSLSREGGLVVTQLCASNEGLLRPRVARGARREE